MADDALKNQVMTGVDKAAILLSTLDSKTAVEVLDFLDDDMVVKLAKHTPLYGKNIQGDEMSMVMNDFVEVYKSPSVTVSRSGVRKMLEGVLDNDRLERILYALDERDTISIWRKIAGMKPGSIYALISDENPQIMAIILAQLEPDLASQVLGLVPPDQQMPTVLRMSKLENVSREMIAGIERALEERLSADMWGQGLSFDGVVRVVDILKTLDDSVSKPILDNLREIDQELFEMLDSQIVVFEDLIAVSSADVQQLLQNVDQNDLIKALKGASDGIRTLFFGSMSERASEIMKEDMEVMGALKLSEVQAAQKKILNVARDLEEKGEITLSSKEEMVS
ncbi:MAG: flagellar motor switch protein FliG [Zetaproteobacteria bacterium]|nr:flagellar motor switch protein FliG [Zetaproteobacteria bacterium]